MKMTACYLTKCLVELTDLLAEIYHYMAGVHFKPCEQLLNQVYFIAACSLGSRVSFNNLTSLSRPIDRRTEYVCGQPDASWEVE